MGDAAMTRLRWWPARHQATEPRQDYRPGVEGRLLAAGLRRPAGRAAQTARLAATAVLSAATVTALFATGVFAGVGQPGQPVVAAGGKVFPGIVGHWVPTWVAAPQLTETSNMPPPPFTNGNVVFADSTIRQTIHVTIPGQQIRLRFSNAYGGADLPITMVSVARPANGAAGVSAIVPGSSQPVTFDGNAGVDIPVGAQAVSDPLNFPVTSSTNLTVTIYLQAGQQSASITSHPGSRTDIWMVNGNHLTDTDLTGAATVAHWYFLSGAEVWSPPHTAAIDIVGDSLTDGRGSTTDQNDKWTDQLFTRLHANPATSSLSVLNLGLGGNRILNDGLGPNVLARVDRDVLTQSGVKWMILWEGVNDIGTAAATPDAQKQVEDSLIAAYQQIITRVHAMGIRVYGATITPFGGNNLYDDPAGLRDQTRQAVNQWIRTSGKFDAVLDFDKAVRDPANPRQILPAFNSGDGLHLNPAGYGAIANSVPFGLFRPGQRPAGFGFR
jgi:lysophospholipase L1-like esterase